MQYLILVAIKAGRLWYAKNTNGLAATVSYYMLFAIIPLLFLTVLITSAVYGKDLVISIFDNWGNVLGSDMLVLLHDAVKNFEALTNGFAIPVTGFLFFSGMMIIMFNIFADGLHWLWEVPNRGGVRRLMQKITRAVVFIVVLELYALCLIGFSIVLSTMSGIFGGVVVSLIESAFFIIATTVLFNFAYRILPLKSPALKARLAGAFIASILFYVTKSFVAWYVVATPIPGLFGSAGVILVLLIWVYISCAIIYYGAAFAQVLGSKR